MKSIAPRKNLIQDFIRAQLTSKPELSLDDVAYFARRNCDPVYLARFGVEFAHRQRRLCSERGRNPTVPISRTRGDGESIDYGARRKAITILLDMKYSGEIVKLPGPRYPLRFASGPNLKKPVQAESSDAT